MAEGVDRSTDEWKRKCTHVSPVESRWWAPCVFTILLTEVFCVLASLHKMLGNKTVGNTASLNDVIGHDLFWRYWNLATNYECSSHMISHQVLWILHCKNLLSCLQGFLLYEVLLGYSHTFFIGLCLLSLIDPSHGCQINCLVHSIDIFWASAICKTLCRSWACVYFWILGAQNWIDRNPGFKMHSHCSVKDLLLCS